MASKPQLEALTLAIENASDPQSNIMEYDDDFRRPFSDDLIVSVMQRLVSIKAGTPKELTEDLVKKSVGKAPEYVEAVTKVI